MIYNSSLNASLQQLRAMKKEGNDISFRVMGNAKTNLVRIQEEREKGLINRNVATEKLRRELSAMNDHSAGIANAALYGFTEMSSICGQISYYSAHDTAEFVKEMAAITRDAAANVLMMSTMMTEITQQYVTAIQEHVTEIQKGNFK